jgi:hypothetical protein
MSPITTPRAALLRVLPSALAAVLLLVASWVLRAHGRTSEGSLEIEEVVRRARALEASRTRHRSEMERILSNAGLTAALVQVPPSSKGHPEIGPRTGRPAVIDRKPKTSPGPRTKFPSELAPDLRVEYAQDSGLSEISRAGEAIAILPLTVEGSVPARLASLESAVARGLEGPLGSKVLVGPTVEIRLLFAGMFRSDCKDPSCWARVGRILSARYLLAGSVRRVNDTFTVSFSLVDSLNGRLVREQQLSCAAEECSVAELSRQAVRELALQAFPVTAPGTNTAASADAASPTAAHPTASRAGNSETSPPPASPPAPAPAPAPAASPPAPTPAKAP